MPHFIILNPDYIIHTKGDHNTPVYVIMSSTVCLALCLTYSKHLLHFWLRKFENTIFTILQASILFFFLSAKRVAVNDFDLLDMLQFVGISPREALRINCSVPAENMTWIIWNIISANLESEGLFYAQELNFLFLLRAKFWVVDIIKWSYSFFLFFFKWI